MEKCCSAKSCYHFYHPGRTPANFWHKKKGEKDFKDTNVAPAFLPMLIFPFQSPAQHFTLLLKYKSEQLSIFLLSQVSNTQAEILKCSVRGLLIIHVYLIIHVLEKEGKKPQPLPKQEKNNWLFHWRTKLEDFELPARLCMWLLCLIRKPKVCKNLI